MIDHVHALPIARQARELGISRGSVYYLPRLVSASDLAIMREIDELHMDFPFAGSRMLRDLLGAEGIMLLQVDDMFGVKLQRDRQAIDRATIVEDDFGEALSHARQLAALLPDQRDLVRLIDRNGTGLGYYPVHPTE